MEAGLTLLSHLVFGGDIFSVSISLFKKVVVLFYIEDVFATFGYKCGYASIVSTGTDVS